MAEAEGVAAYWLSGLPGPDPGNFLYAQKVTKKAPGTPRTPLFCPIGLYQNRYRAATEIPLACWSLVIGAVVYRLRLTALGMKDCGLYLIGPIVQGLLFFVDDSIFSLQ